MVNQKWLIGRRLSQDSLFCFIGKNDEKIATGAGFSLPYLQVFDSFRGRYLFCGTGLMKEVANMKRYDIKTAYEYPAARALADILKLGLFCAAVAGIIVLLS